MTRVLSAVALAALVLAIVSLLPPHATLLLAVLASAVAFAEYVDLAAAVGARIPVIASGAAVTAACVSVGGDGPPLEVVCLAAAIIDWDLVRYARAAGPRSPARRLGLALSDPLHRNPAWGARCRPIHRRTRCDAAADRDDRGQRFGAVPTPGVHLAGTLSRQRSVPPRPLKAQLADLFSGPPR